MKALESIWNATVRAGRRAGYALGLALVEPTHSTPAALCTRRTFSVADAVLRSCALSPGASGQP